MIEYKIITQKYNPDFLAELVNRAIAEGWQPAGGVAVANGEFVQAMIRIRKSTGDRRLANALDRRQANPL